MLWIIGCAVSCNSSAVKCGSIKLCWICSDTESWWCLCFCAMRHWSLDFLTVFCKFDSIESATQAKNGLHGQDIYSGCCTIKSEFAKVRPSVNFFGECTFLAGCYS